MSPGKDSEYLEPGYLSIIIDLLELRLELRSMDIKIFNKENCLTRWCTNNSPSKAPSLIMISRWLPLRQNLIRKAKN